MAQFLYKDRIMESSTTAGIGSFIVAGAVAGYQSFSVIGDGNACYYVCEAVDANGVPTGEWEIGLGTYTSASTSLTRAPIKNSAGTQPSALSFSVGTKRIFVPVPEAVVTPMTASAGALANACFS